jgi:signal transduction histidine kinase
MKITVVLAVFFCVFGLQAQPSKAIIDSLLNELPKAKNDTVRSRIYIRLHDNLYQSNPELALHYARKGLKIVTQMKWDKGMCAFHNDIGNNYMDQGKHKEALEHYLQSLEYSKELPSIRVLTLQNTSIVYFKEENIPLSMRYNNEAFSLAQKEKINPSIAECLTTYGLIYSHQKNKTKAQSYFKKSYEIWKSEGNKMKQAIVLSNLGDVSDDLKTKSDYYLQSKAIWDVENPRYLLAVSNVLGLVEVNLTLAKDENLRGQFATSKSKAQLLTEAENYLKEAITYSKQANIQQNLMFAYGKMSEVKELQGKYKEALDYINLNYELYVSIFSQESKNKIATLESKQKLMAKDKEIALKKIAIEQNEKQKWFLIGGLVLLGIIGGLLFYQSRNRKKTNELLQNLNTELDEANKAKTRFFSILNHDLRSPVSNLIDFLHLQKDSPDLLDEATKSRIEQTTLSSAENLLTSMEDILQWSKSQMQNFKPQPQEFEIAQLFEDTKMHFSSVNHIQFQFENPTNISVVTDENYLKTIVRNLTGNAIKALVDVQNPLIIWKAFQENNKTILSITDNGKGASQDQFKALYDDKEVVGIKSGLGLHLIRDLAKAIDCEILVDSKINEGTTITLRF